MSPACYLHLHKTIPYMAASPVSLLQEWLQNQQVTILHHPLSSAILFCSLFFLLMLNHLWKQKVPNLPPAPSKLSFMGHLHYIGSLPHRSLHALGQKYGPLMLLSLGHTPTLVVQSAEMAEQIMKTHDVAFASRPITTASKAFLYGCKDVAFAPYGEYWRQMRKLCILELLSVKRVQSFRFVREEEIRDMVNMIKEACSLGEEVNLSDILTDVTKNVMSRVGLSRRMDGYADLSKETMELFGVTSAEDMFPSLGWIDRLTGLTRRMKKTSTALLEFFDGVIEEHLMARKDAGRHAADRRDFVDLLLDYEDDHRVDGVEFTRENFKGVLMDMFVGGTDTTFTLLEWTMAELVNHPDVLKKLQEEVRRVVGKKSEVDQNETKRVDYLNCVIKETLRLHPPLALLLPRVSTTSTTIQGYTIPPKTKVVINAWAIGRDPKSWDRPNEFIPERFIDNPADFRGQDFEFIPFGAGRRGCPGISFAMTAAESILVNLLYWFDWGLPGDGNGSNNTDMTEVFGLSVKKKYPLRLVPKHHSF